MFTITFCHRPKGSCVLCTEVVDILDEVDLISRGRLIGVVYKYQQATPHDPQWAEWYREHDADDQTLCQTAIAYRDLVQFLGLGIVYNEDGDPSWIRPVAEDFDHLLGSDAADVAAVNADHGVADAIRTYHGNLAAYYRGLPVVRGSTNAREAQPGPDPGLGQNVAVAKGQKRVPEDGRDKASAIKQPAPKRPRAEAQTPTRNPNVSPYFQLEESNQALLRTIDGKKSSNRHLEHLHDNNATLEVEEPVLAQDQAEEELVGDTIVVDVPGLDNFYSSNKNKHDENSEKKDSSPGADNGFVSATTRIVPDLNLTPSPKQLEAARHLDIMRQKVNRHILRSGARRKEAPAPQERLPNTENGRLIEIARNSRVRLEVEAWKAEAQKNADAFIKESEEIKDERKRRVSSLCLNLKDGEAPSVSGGREFFGVARWMDDETIAPCEESLFYWRIVAGEEPAKRVSRTRRRFAPNRHVHRSELDEISRRYPHLGEVNSNFPELGEVTRSTADTLKRISKVSISSKILEKALKKATCNIPDSIKILGTLIEAPLPGEEDWLDDSANSIEVDATGIEDAGGEDSNVDEEHLDELGNRYVKWEPAEERWARARRRHVRTEN